MATAFFSYSRTDSEFALRLAGDLKAAGLNVWLDQLDIVPGQQWDRAVEEELTRSPRMLVILSPSSIESANVMDEVSFALEQRKTVIPVIHADCRIPYRLRRLQHVDFTKDYARGLSDLLKALGSGPEEEEEVQLQQKRKLDSEQARREQNRKRVVSPEPRSGVLSRESVSPQFVRKSLEELIAGEKRNRTYFLLTSLVGVLAGIGLCWWTIAAHLGEVYTRVASGVFPLITSGLSVTRIAVCERNIARYKAASALAGARGAISIKFVEGILLGEAEHGAGHRARD
jgi:hypothetical protein